MAIIRQKRKKRFSIVDNNVIEDRQLSFKARGLLIYMLSKPDDWKFYPDELAKHSDKEGVKAINSALQEIESAGYLTRKRKRDAAGHFQGIDYLLSEIPHDNDPQSQNRNAGKRDAGSRNAGNGILPNTDFKPNTDLTNTDRSLIGDQHTTQDVFDLWQSNWGFPNGIAQQDLTEWINEFGADLVTFAITYALRRNVKSTGADRYLDQLLKAYKKKGISTVEQAKNEDKQHQQQMSREYQNMGGRRRPAHADPVKKDYTPPKGFDR